MQFAGFLAESEKFEIQAYKKPKSLNLLLSRFLRKIIIVPWLD